MFKFLGFFRRRLAVQFIVRCLLLVGVVWTALSLWIIKSERDVLEQDLVAQGTAVSRAVANGCVEFMLVELDTNKLETLVRGLVNEEDGDVVYAWVEDADGEVLVEYPADKDLSAAMENQNRRFSADVLTRLGEDDSVPPVFESIGRVVLGISTERSTAFIESRARSLATWSIVAFVLFAGVIALSMRRVVGRRLHTLSDQADALGQGDLDSEIRVAGEDELSFLGTTLNGMRASLKRSYTSLSESKAEIEEQNEELKVLDKLKSEFLANISHEIRTPMTAILGFSETIGDENATPEERATAGSTIRRNGTHLLSLVNDILDFSKLDAGGVEIEEKPMLVGPLLDQVEAATKHYCGRKQLSFVAERADLPEAINGDVGRMRQVLINIAGNAVKFSEKGEVSIRSHFDSGDLVCEIADQGTGIADEDREHIFSAFTQRDTSMTRNHGGTGMGLAIAGGLVELLEGEIEIESERGKGSLFRVRIPVELCEASLVESPSCVLTSVRLEEPLKFGFEERDAPEPKAEEETSATEADGDTPKPKKRRARAKKPAGPQLDSRVILAEDGPDNQRLISFVLKKAGVDVLVCENGKLALDEAKRASDEDKPYDVILMDMQMPVMDGYTATRSLRELGYDRPIIALTAHALDGEKKKCLDAGCDEFATKPIDRSSLLGLIEHYTKLVRGG